MRLNPKRRDKKAEVFPQVVCFSETYTPFSPSGCVCAASDLKRDHQGDASCSSSSSLSPSQPQPDAVSPAQPSKPNRGPCQRCRAVWSLQTGNGPRGEPAGSVISAGLDYRLQIFACLYTVVTLSQFIPFTPRRAFHCLAFGLLGRRF